MTIITPTGITGITSITSTGNTLQFQNASGADVSVSGLNVTSGTNINVSGIITASGGFSGNINSTGVSTFRNIVGVSTIGVTTAYVTTINDGPISGARNIIINGSMVINQRGWTGAAGTTISDVYTTDRFRIEHSHDGAVSVGQTSMNSTTGGNAYADGFRNALFFNVTTADASLAASQYQVIEHRIEGFNVQGIKKGTTNALPVTLSFWVRSTTTGTYVAELYDGDNSRSVSQTYTINIANTWEKKVLTFPADTTGAFDNDNAVSLYIEWWLAAGSTFSGGTLQTTWGSVVTTNRAAGQTNLLASAGNNFWLTGVQLEVGSVATPFERRSYGQELALCQRYFETITYGGNGMVSTGQAYSTTNAQAPFSWKVTKRGTPTISLSSGASPRAYNATGTANNATYTFNNITTDCCWIEVASSGLVAGNASLVYLATSGNSVIISSEL